MVCLLPIQSLIVLVDSVSHLYPAPITAVLYAMSCYNGPRYSGTQP